MSFTLKILIGVVLGADHLLSLFIVVIAFKRGVFKLDMRRLAKALLVSISTPGNR